MAEFTDDDLGRLEHILSWYTAPYGYHNYYSDLYEKVIQMRLERQD